jgi:LmbE family N-acetylglucosaminyl deacetylase
MKDINNFLLNIKNKTLLVIFPHPDDETMATGGLILAAKKAGYKVVVLILTKGGAGKIFIRVNGFSLKEIREIELTRAVNILGVDKLLIEDLDDGKLRQQTKQIAILLNSYIAKYEPGLVVTYDPSGFYGHPDHIILSKVLYGKLKILNPELQIQLLFVAVPQLFKNKLPLRGMREVEENMVEATHVLDLGWGWVKKWLAAKEHKSQGLGKSMKVPMWLFMAINHFEYYHVVSLEDQFKYKFKFIDYQI